LNWRIFLPEAWDDDHERRAKAHVPDDVVHREKWRLALDMLDELKEWGLVPPLVGTDAGYGESTEFRRGLDDRQIPYMVQVKKTTSAYPEPTQRERSDYGGMGRPPTARYRTAPCSLKELVLAAGKRAAHGVTWREGSRGRMHSRFVALRVKPANRQLIAAAQAADRELQVRWLLAEWPSDADAPTDYWLSSLPADTPLKTLVGLAKLRWRIEHDYRELKDGLGLDHFEGRSYRGWHHHVTLVSVAHAFLTLERRRPPTRAAA
jgi:SRSO17 transposase